MRDAIHIVCLLGATGSGKSAVATTLEKHHGFVRVRFAQTLKDMLRAMGLSALDVDGPQEHRNKPHRLLLGKSPRYAMQTLGTEWRAYIGESLWSAILVDRVKRMIADGKTRIVIDDMRFPHELEALGELGAVTVAIRRASVEASTRQQWVSRLPKWLQPVAALLTGTTRLHPSEGLWYHMPHDISVYNCGSLHDLRADVAEVVGRL